MQCWGCRADTRCLCHRIWLVTKGFWFMLCKACCWETTLNELVERYNELKKKLNLVIFSVHVLACMMFQWTWAELHYDRQPLKCHQKESCCIAHWRRYLLMQWGPKQQPCVSSGFSHISFNTAERERAVEKIRPRRVCDGNPGNPNSHYTFFVNAQQTLMSRLSVSMFMHFQTAGEKVKNTFKTVY